MRSPQMDTNFSIKSFAQYYLIHPNETPKKWRCAAKVFSFLSCAFLGLAHLLCYWHNRQVKWKRVKISETDGKVQELFLSKIRLEKEKSPKSLWLLANYHVQEDNKTEAKSLCERVVKESDDASLKEKAQKLLKSLMPTVISDPTPPRPLPDPLTEEQRKELWEKVKQQKFDEVSSVLTTLEKQVDFTHFLLSEELEESIHSGTVFDLEPLSKKDEVWAQFFHVLCNKERAVCNIAQFLDQYLTSISEAQLSKKLAVAVYERALSATCEFYINCGKEDGFPKDFRQKLIGHFEKATEKYLKLKDLYSLLLLVEGRDDEFQKIRDRGTGFETYLLKNSSLVAKLCKEAIDPSDSEKWADLPLHRLLFELVAFGSLEDGHTDLLDACLEKIDQEKALITKYSLNSSVTTFICESIDLRRLDLQDEDVWKKVVGYANRLDDIGDHKETKARFLTKAKYYKSPKNPELLKQALFAGVTEIIKKKMWDALDPKSFSLEEVNTLFDLVKANNKEFLEGDDLPGFFAFVAKICKVKKGKKTLPPALKAFLEEKTLVDPSSLKRKLSSIYGACQDPVSWVAFLEKNLTVKTGWETIELHNNLAMMQLPPSISLQWYRDPKGRDSRKDEPFVTGQEKQGLEHLTALFALKDLFGNHGEPEGFENYTRIALHQCHSRGIGTEVDERTAKTYVTAQVRTFLEQTMGKNPWPPGISRVEGKDTGGALRRDMKGNNAI